MDHHCIFTNNCVGFYNYKYYMVFLFWSFVTLVFLLTTQISTVFEILQKEERTWSDIWAVIVYLWSGLMFFSIGGLALFHMGICRKNMTTLEWREKGSINPDYVNIYDVGVEKNLNQVFGPNLLLWVIPTRKGIPGDGLTFPTNDKAQYQSV